MSRVGGCSHSDRAKSRHDLRGPAIKRIPTCLWFDTAGEEAAECYTSVFPNSTINSVSHHGEAGPRPQERIGRHPLAFRHAHDTDRRVRLDVHLSAASVRPESPSRLPGSTEDA